MNRYQQARSRLPKKVRRQVMQHFRQLLDGPPVPQEKVDLKGCAFSIGLGDDTMCVVASVDRVERVGEEPYVEEHVSFSYADRLPSWDEVVLVRALAWTDDKEVYQVLPALTGPQGEPWVNRHEFTLHLQYRRPA